MGEKVLKHAAVFTCVLMLSVIVFSLIITYEEGNSGKSSAFAKVSPTFYEKKNESKDYLATSSEEKDILGDKYIAVKDTGIYTACSLKEDDINRQITLSLKGLKGKSLSEESIFRINREKVYEGAASLAEKEKNGYLVPEVLSADGGTGLYSAPEDSLSTDPVYELGIKYSKSDDGTYEADILFTLDSVYAPEIRKEKDQIYILLRKPSEVYENIVVLDAGHGGKDPGAEASDGSSYEKNINLDILLYLKEILDGENIKVYYTRTGDDTVYLNPRVNLANEVQADLFLSIHCNSSESSQPRGLEVLYKSNWDQGGFSSERLARIALDEMKDIIGYVNRGIVAGDEIVIIKKAQVPVALIETGFLSNPEELAFLKSGEKQKEIARGIAEVIKKALQEKKEAELQ